MIIKYGGIQYQVGFQDQILDNAEEKLGGFSPHKHSILVSKDQTAESMYITLLHELVHMVAIHAGQDFTEGQIDAVSYGLYQLQLENPELWGKMKDETNPNKPKPRRLYRKAAGKSTTTKRRK